jgi:hypothetical protein
MHQYCYCVISSVSVMCSLCRIITCLLHNHIIREGGGGGGGGRFIIHRGFFFFFSSGGGRFIIQKKKKQYFIKKTKENISQPCLKYREREKGLITIEESKILMSHNVCFPPYPNKKSKISPSTLQVHQRMNT